MNTIAERYVKLVLAVGQHDADYVDAFYGPAEWKAEAERRKLPLAEIDAAAARLIADIPALSDADRRDELVVLRRDYLRRQLEALRTRVRMLAGREADVRRGVAGALRRGRAGASRVVLRRGAEGARAPAAGRRPARRSLRRLPADVRHPVRPARARVRPRDRRMPDAHAGARARCRRTRASRSSTSRTSRGAATTGTRATTAA